MSEEQVLRLALPSTGLPPVFYYTDGHKAFFLDAEIQIELLQLPLTYSLHHRAEAHGA